MTYYRCILLLLLPAENQQAELLQATRRPVEAYLIDSVRVVLHHKRSAQLTSVPRECRQSKPSMPMTPYVRQLENENAVQERAKMTYGPDGRESTKEDEDALELATLRLLFKCSTNSCSNQETCLPTDSSDRSRKLLAKLRSLDARSSENRKHESIE
jgi:hypothetical protein